MSRWLKGLKKETREKRRNGGPRIKTCQTWRQVVMVWHGVGRLCVRKQKAGDRDDETSWVTIRDDRAWHGDLANGSTVEAGIKVRRAEWRGDWKNCKWQEEKKVDQREQFCSYNDTLGNLNWSPWKENLKIGLVKAINGRSRRSNKRLVFLNWRW